MEACCRICYCSSLDEHEKLISPCFCRGSQANVHRSCLENWIVLSGRHTCEICKYHYKIERSLKCSKPLLLYHWLVNSERKKEPSYFFNQIKLLTYLLPAFIISFAIIQNSPGNINQIEFISLDITRDNHFYIYLIYSMTNQILWLTNVIIWMVLLMISMMMMGVYGFLVMTVVYFQSKEWTKWLDKNTVTKLVL